MLWARLQVGLRTTVGYDINGVNPGLERSRGVLRVMRIVQLSTMAGYYGGEVCVAALARGLAARGHEVSLVTRPHSALADRLEGGPVQIRRRSLVGWWEPWGVASLAAWLRRSGAEILHTHLPRDHYLAACATLGTPVVNVGTRHQLHCFRHRPLKRPFLGRLSAMVAVSNAVARGLKRQDVLDPRRVVVIPNGVEDAAAGAAPIDLRRLAGVSAEAPVVGAVGRLCPSKGLEVLLRAAAILRPHHPELRILLVGDAPRGSGHAAELSRLAAKLGLGGAVVFCGYVPEAERGMADLDVLAVCSAAEPCGLVSLEAMTRGVPVVATTTGGSPELVRDGREGYLVNPGDPTALAARLDRLLRDPELRSELGRRGQERVRRHFALAGMLDATEDLYHRLLGIRSVSRSSGECAAPWSRKR